MIFGRINLFEANAHNVGISKMIYLHHLDYVEDVFEFKTKHHKEESKIKSENNVFLAQGIKMLMNKLDYVLNA